MRCCTPGAAHTLKAAAYLLVLPRCMPGGLFLIGNRLIAALIVTVTRNQLRVSGSLGICNGRVDGGATCQMLALFSPYATISKESSTTTARLLRSAYKIIWKLIS